MKLLFCCLLPACFVPMSYAQSPPPAPLQTIKSRSIALLSGGCGYGPRRLAQIEENHRWCKEILSRPFQPVSQEDASGRPLNIRLAESAALGRRLATVYCCDTGSLFRSPEIKLRIEGLLSNILEHFNEMTVRPDNWFFWQIVIPDHLGATALLMEQELPEPLLIRLRAALAFELKQLILVGVNGVWEARNHVRLALLDGDTGRLARAAEHAFSNILYGRESGVREDYGYLFHGRIPYAGGYGAGFAQASAEFFYLFAETPWAARQERCDIVGYFLLEHARWFMLGGQVDMLVMGRSFASQAKAYAQLTEAVLLMMEMNASRRGDLLGFAAHLLAAEPELPFSVAWIADRLPASQPSVPAGFRYWPSAEIGAFNMGAFHAGFRQYSKRVQDYEYLTQDGAEGWNLAFGCTTVLREDGSGSWYEEGDRGTKAKHSLKPQIDLQHLPGATVRIGGNPPNAGSGYRDSGHSLNFGTEAFAGGAGGPSGGVAGFILRPAYGDFRAKKSLHFFPQGFWAIGTDIESTDRQWSDGHPLHTTVLQWPCATAAPSLTADGEAVSLAEGETRTIAARWIWLERMAVVFETSAALAIRREGPVVTAWLDHTAQPSAARYAYATLPDISLVEAERFAKALPVRPIRADSRVHAVLDPAGRRDSLVFFAPDTSLGIVSDRPAIVWHQSGNDGGIFAVQDPLHQDDDLTLSAAFSGELTDPAASIVSAEAGKHSTVKLRARPGRIHCFGYGRDGRQVRTPPGADLAGLRHFKVAAENDPEKTILAISIPEGLHEQDYTLAIHGNQGHPVAILTEKDILDRPSANTARYVWRRGEKTPSGSPSHARQMHGDFRLFFRTEFTESVEYFTVPFYTEDGREDPFAEFYRDRDNPARPKIPWAANAR